MNRCLEAKLNSMIAQDLLTFTKHLEARKENRRELLRTIFFIIVAGLIVFAFLGSAFSIKQPDLASVPIQLAIDEVLI